MEPRQPSQTAFAVAVQRALHQTLEGGRIFSDPFAVQMVGRSMVEAAEGEALEPTKLSLRRFVTARSRLGEDALAGAVHRGVRQGVILGAGLDTFALRNPFRDLGLRVFEVDHPATQAWKRHQLASAGLERISDAVFVPVDFETENLSSGLVAAGFDANAPSFFLWLGVVPYLTRDATIETLRFIASLPSGEVVFDYSEPLENMPAERRQHAAAVEAKAAALGEPMISRFNPEEMTGLLSKLGFQEIEDLGMTEIALRFFGGPAKSVIGGGPHVVRARSIEL